jgi:hypothetical protein
MMRYQDKPLEEITPILENYIISYRLRTGKMPDKETIKKKLLEIAQAKEDNQFYNTVEGLTTKSIYMTVQYVDSIFEAMQRPQEPEPKKKKAKK